MADDGLADFIDTVCGESRLRVEADLGNGFVRLRSSEAERRQAAQDIRSSEDIVIELLRNSRDAGARHIFVATQRAGSQRLITVVDDGGGIPAAQHERIFEPRVTSKLDTAHMDKWGMHGRGMALYSISENAAEARVCLSAPGCGTSLSVRTDTDRLGEKTDQSTFPRFERGPEGVLAMRGPKNIVRTVAEFALEHRGEVAVFFGTPVEIAATLHAFGVATLSAAVRAFPGKTEGFPIVKQAALMGGPDELAAWCEAAGLPLSGRSARRIIDGVVGAVPAMLDRIRNEGLGATAPEPARNPRRSAGRGLQLAAEDVERLSEAARTAVESLAGRYYLDGVGDPRVSVGSDAIRITVPIRTMD